MLLRNRHILLFILLAWCGMELYAQSNLRDSLTVDSLLKSNKPLILNREMIENIKFEGKFELLPDPLSNPSFLLVPDATLPEIIIEKDGSLTLRPYTIYTKPYEDPIQSLSPPITMNTELGPGGQVTGSPGVSIIFTFDAETILRRIFWKSERAKRSNAKRVQAHKYY